FVALRSIVFECVVRNVVGQGNGLVLAGAGFATGMKFVFGLVVFIGRAAVVFALHVISSRKKAARGMRRPRASDCEERRFAALAKLRSTGAIASSCHGRTRAP